LCNQGSALVIGCWAINSFARIVSYTEWDETNAFTGEQVRILNKFGAHLESLPWHPPVKSQEKTHVSARTGGNPADVQTRNPNTGLRMPVTTSRGKGGKNYL
jgi:hypothetical protein